MHGEVFMRERLCAPPREIYSLHRKLAGAFSCCIRFGVVMPCRPLLAQTYAQYEWGGDEGATAEGADVAAGVGTTVVEGQRR